MSEATIMELTNNIRRVFKKMGRELEPGNSEHSNLIDLVNHGDSLAEQIEAEIMATDTNPGPGIG